MLLGSALERSTVLGVLGFETLPLPCPSLSVTLAMKEGVSSVLSCRQKTLPGSWP